MVRLYLFVFLFISFYPSTAQLLVPKDDGFLRCRIESRHRKQFFFERKRVRGWMNEWNNAKILNVLRNLDAFNIVVDFMLCGFHAQCNFCPFAPFSHASFSWRMCVCVLMHSAQSLLWFKWFLVMKKAATMTVTRDERRQNAENQINALVFVCVFTSRCEDDVGKKSVSRIYFAELAARWRACAVMHVCMFLVS